MPDTTSFFGFFKILPFAFGQWCLKLYCCLLYTSTQLAQSIPSFSADHLTVHRVDSNSCSAACETAGQEWDVERSRTISVPAAQAVQVSKQWEVNDGKGHIPEGERETHTNTHTHHREIKDERDTLCCTDWMTELP